MTDTMTRLLFAILILFAAYVAGVETYMLSHFLTNPIKILKVEIANQEVMYGDQLIIENTYERYAYCKSDLDRFIIRETDGLLIRRERVPSGTTELGVHSRKLMLPTVIPGGNPNFNLTPTHVYKILTFIHSDCGDRLHSSAGPVATFNVTPYSTPP